VDRRSDNATAVDVEIDPYCRRLGRSQTDFAFQAIVECRAAKAKRVAVLLRWHADGGEVRRGLAVGRCRASAIAITHMRAHRARETLEEP